LSGVGARDGPSGAPSRPKDPPARGADAAVETDAAFRKVTLRLLPLLGLCYLAAYLDRVNVGFAKLEMARDLGLSDVAYGLGAGVFFIGYFLFEVPSNLILHRVGAKAWLARNTERTGSSRRTGSRSSDFHWRPISPTRTTSPTRSASR